MKQVNEDTIFAEFFTLATVDVDDSHVAAFVAGGHAHKAAGMDRGKIWPAEESTKMALSQTADVVGFGAVGES